MNPSFTPRHAILLAALAAAYPTIGLGAGAARVDFATHGVNAQAPDGSRRVLAKGSEVLPGDTVITNQGRAQMRFTDGALVSLKPGSEFRIDEYRYNGNADREERGFFSLLKGGLRTITGLIGRTERNNYQVRTATATIGIRGTEYSVTYGNSINVNTGEGIVEVCNSTGCLLLYPGDEGYVEADSKPPVLVQTGEERPKKDDAPPEVSNIEAPSNDRESNGSVAGLGGLLTGTRSYGYATAGEGSASAFTGTGTINAQGVLTNIDNGGNIYNPDLGGGGTVASLGNDGVVAWGRWVFGTGGLINGSSISGSSFHYVAGLPTQDNPTTLPNATFSLLGGSVSGSSTGNGSVTGASMNVSFSALTVNSWSIDATVGSDVYAISGGTATINNNAGLDFSTSSNSFTTSTNCSSGCTASVSGAFFGSGASRAGMGFSISGGVETVIGAVALTKN